MKNMPKEKFKIVAAVMIMTMIGTMSMSMSLILSGVSLSFPDKSLSSIQMMFTISSLASLLAGFVTGWLASKINKKKLCILAQILTIAAGAIAFFMSNSFAMLYVANFVIGFMLMLLSNLESALLAENFDFQERVGFFGIQALFMHGAGVLVQLLSGYLVTLGWRFWYLITLLLIPTTIAAMALLPEGGLEKPVKEGNVKFLNPYFISKYIQSIGLGIVYGSYYANISFIVGEVGADVGFAGTLNAVYEIIVVVMGIILTQYVKLFKKNASWVSLIFIAASMWAYAFATSKIYMILGCVFLGIGFGSYICLILAELPDHVNPTAMTKSISVYTTGLSIGMFICPYVITPLATLVGEGAGKRFMLAAAIMTAIVVIFKFIDDSIMRKEAAVKAVE